MSARHAVERTLRAGFMARIVVQTALSVAHASVSGMGMDTVLDSAQAEVTVACTALKTLQTMAAMLTGRSDVPDEKVNRPRVPIQPSCWFKMAIAQHIP